MLILSIDLGIVKKHAYMIAQVENKVNIISIESVENILDLKPQLKKVNIVIVEKPYYFKNVKVYGDFWYLIGRLSVLCENYGNTLVLVRPYDWKNKLKLTAKQSKEERQKNTNAILKHYSLNGKELTEDEVTAVLIGHYYIKYLND